ncbi:MAG: sulfatase [Acidobacteria bacterium]|nr:sulfatase [Acidobacteriota bacterium]
MRHKMELSRRSFLRTSAVAAAVPSETPNFVFLLSDDQSRPHLGCYGDPVIRTPNLDRLAREGMRFENTFVSSSQCSPNRSSILTGCTPHTIGTSRLHTPMPDWEPTIVDHLKERGYFVGAYRKVHQGPRFDKRWSFYGGPQLNFETFFDALPKGKPFYLHAGFTDPHRPYRPGAFQPPHDRQKIPVPKFLPDTPEVREDLGNYYDYIARMDADCGRLMEILKRRGLDRNTLIIATGDNGMPFPRAKGTCYDIGLRVPMLAWWPGRVRAGAVAQELIAHVDLPATWLEAAGAARPPKMQGRSFLGLLTGGAYQPRTEVFSERNWHDNFDPIRSVRTGRHKLIFNAAPHFPYRPAWDLADSPTWAAIQRLGRAGKLTPPQMRLLDPTRPLLELYDLERDPDEFHNLVTSPEHAGVLKDLRQRLGNWMQDTCDYLPPFAPL